MLSPFFLLGRKHFHTQFLDQPEQHLKNSKNKQTKTLQKKKVTVSFPPLAYPSSPSCYAGQTSHQAENFTCKGGRRFNIEPWLFHMVSQMENHKAG